MPAVESRADSLTVPELATLSGYAKQSLHYRIRRGLLEASRDERGVWRVPASEIPALIQRERYSREDSNG